MKVRAASVPLRFQVVLLLGALMLLGSPQAKAQASPRPAQPIVQPDTELNRELDHAVRHGDVRRVRALLRAGANPDVRSGWGKPEDTLPLWFWSVSHAATQERGNTSFALLAERIADPNQQTSYGQTLLAAAAETGNVGLVKALVARGAKVNQLSDNRYPTTPLLTAINQGGDRTDLTPLIRFLLDAGGDPNLLPGLALSAAAMGGKTETVRALLAHGADPTFRDKNGWTALRYAAIKGNPSVIALLRDVSPLTLQEAALFAALPKVRERLDAGDDPNLADKRGETPLMSAMRGGSKAAAALLIARGAKVDARAKDGSTALHLAARYGLPDLVNLLLQHGADINAAKPHEENTPASTPLTEAAERAQAEVVAVLLRWGVNLQRHAQGFTALEITVREAGQLAWPLRDAPGARILNADQIYENRSRILEMLTRAGGRALVRSRGSYVLYVAAEHHDPTLVRYLLDKGADINGQDESFYGISEGGTALLGAIFAWGSAVSQQHELKTRHLSGPSLTNLRDDERWAKNTFYLLLSRGASVKLPNAAGQTPLMAAYEWHLPDLFQELMRHGAAINARDGEGATVLMQAAAKGDSDWVERLLRAGADARLRNPTGKTALDLARSSGSARTVTLLKLAMVRQ